MKKKLRLCLKVPQEGNIIPILNFYSCVPSIQGETEHNALLHYERIRKDNNNEDVILLSDNSQRPTTEITKKNGIELKLHQYDAKYKTATSLKSKIFF